MDTVAQVLVSIRNYELDMTFTYSIPAGMNLVPGSRVIVPFGNQRLEGYCIELNQGSFTGEIKEIEEVLDDEPLLTDEHLALAKWGAGHYLCRRLDFLFAMLPAGLRFSAKKWVHYIGSSNPEGEALSFLKEKTKLPLVKWRQAFPKEVNERLLRQLVQNGIIELYCKERRGMKEKKTTLVSLTEAGKSANVTGNKQKIALSLLKNCSELSLTAFADKGITRATVQTLLRHGFVHFREAIIRRDPLALENAFPEARPQNTQAQNDALKKIMDSVNDSSFSKILLYGVTGSGKTEVYMQAIEGAMRQGKGSIFLVPEIALTPQMIERFISRFGQAVAVLHSRLSLGERYDEWYRVAHGDAQIVIGTRSAVFAPFKNVGLIILDEEHEPSYKQEDSPRYHARDVAIWRARWHNATVVLGSATPSLESRYRASQGQYSLCRLPCRVEERTLPPVEVVDMRLEMNEGHRSVFSRKMLASMADVLAKGEQIILFINRRGYATFVICRSCGHVMRCPHCQVALKFHADEEMLCCHYCNHWEKYPLVCPSCAGRYIKYFGTGTQKVAEEVRRFFPEASVSRLDADVTGRVGAHKKILNSFKRGETDILVGTQMVAKGLDFPNVTLVGVVTADTVLNFPDFRASERTFQLLTQVAGRAGRGPAGGEVIVQTYAPLHYAVLAAGRHDFDTFYEEEIISRQELGYPPFSFLVRLVITGDNEDYVSSTAGVLAGLFNDSVELLGPSPCPIAKLKGKFRWHLIVRGTEIESLVQAVKEVSSIYRQGPRNNQVRLIVDVEPLSLL